MSILLTGFSGNIGSALSAELRDRRVLALVREEPKTPPPLHVRLLLGSLQDLPREATSDVDTIIHAAADTSFRAPLETLRSTNVEGTRSLLDFARRCPQLERFIHISTVCVCGASCGLIPETSIVSEPAFVNAYEQSKWEAEQVVLTASVPAEIVRLSTVAGRESDGAVHRLGALHQSIYWLWRGLIPLIPSAAGARVDVVSTEFATHRLRELLDESVCPGRITHITSGPFAPTLPEVLDLIFETFVRHHAAWARGALARPVFADASTWHLFASAAAESGDALFSKVIADAQSFLPALLHPRTYATRYPAVDWQPLVERTVEHLIHTDWHRAQ